MLNANFTNVFFGNTVIKCTIWQLNSSAAPFKQLSPGLADKYEVKRSAYSSSVHKTCSFYNICFSIEQKMGNYEIKSLNYNGFFFNKNTRLVTSFTALDFFYELLYCTFLMWLLAPRGSVKESSGSLVVKRAGNFLIYER